jgi:hypothetical protein
MQRLNATVRLARDGAESGSIAAPTRQMCAFR